MSASTCDVLQVQCFYTNIFCSGKYLLFVQALLFLVSNDRHPNHEENEVKELYKDFEI